MKRQPDIDVPDELSLRRRTPLSNWTVDFRINGERIQRSTKNANERRAYKRGEEIYREEYAKRVGSVHGKTITLRAACEAFLDDKQDEIEKGDMQKSTWIMHRTLARRMQGFKTNRWKTAVVPVPGLIDPDAYLQSIDQQTLDAFLKSMKKEYASETYRINVVRLRAFVNWCQHPSQNYAMQALVFPDPKTKSGQKHFGPVTKRRRTFSEEQKDELLTIVGESKNPENVLLLLILYDLPIRHGEAVAVHWADIKLRSKEITVRRTKGSLETTARMSDRLTEQFKVRARSHGSSGYVFPSVKTATGHRSAKADKWFRRAVDKLSDQPNSPETVALNNGERLVVHTLRHTLGALMAPHMVPQMIQSNFGHASIQQAMHYSEVHGGHATSALAGILNKREASKSGGSTQGELP